MPRSLAACFDQVDAGDGAHRAGTGPRRQAPRERAARAPDARRHRGDLPGRAARVPDRVHRRHATSWACASSAPTWEPSSALPSHVDPRRAESRHALPLRPRRSCSARRWCACGPRRTRARRCSPTRCASRRRSTSSTGSRTRSRTIWRAWCSPSRRASCSIEVDLVAEMSVHQPVRLLPRAERREVPVPLRRERSCTSSRPISSRGPLTPRFKALPGRDPARADADGRFPGRAEPAAGAGHRAT